MENFNLLSFALIMEMGFVINDGNFPEKISQVFPQCISSVYVILDFSEKQDRCGIQYN